MDQALSYEQARDELTEVVKRLEAGGLTLEQSLEEWERGERLAAICADWLEGARARIATAMAQRAGDASGQARPPEAQARPPEAQAGEASQTGGAATPRGQTSEPSAPF